MAFRSTVPDRVPLRGSTSYCPLKFWQGWPSSAFWFLVRRRSPTRRFPTRPGDAPVPRASADITRKVMINDMKLQEERQHVDRRPRWRIGSNWSRASTSIGKYRT